MINNFNKPFFLLVIFVFVITGCNPKNDFKKKKVIKFSSINTIIQLKGKPVKLNEKIIYPFRMQIFDSLLIIYDIKNENNMLHFYNTNGFTYLGGACKKGMGPGEFIGLASIDTWNMKDGFWCFDITKSSITKFFLDSALNNPHYVPTPELKIRRPKIFGFLQVSDSTFISSFFGYEPRLALFNFSLDTLYSFLHYPPLKNTYNLPKWDFQYLVKAYMYKGHIYKNIKRHKVVICFFNTAAIQIVDYISGELIKTIIGPDDTFPPRYDFHGGRAVIKRESKRGYICLYLTDDYIYALYSGKQSKDPYSVTSNQIIQFDWNGVPVKKYILDHRLISFVFDEKNNKFYGNDIYSDIPFVEFALPE